MSELREPLLTLLFTLHFLGFGFLYLKRRELHYTRLCALFGALVLYYLMGWMSWNPSMMDLEVRSMLRIFAWVMTAWSALYYLLRYRRRRAAKL